MICNRLLIADVGQDAVEYRQGRFLSGNRNAGLGHQSEETNGLENHCFASGIRTANHQNSPIRVHVQRDRRHRPLFTPEVIFQQRVTRVNQAEQQAPGKGRAHTVEIAGETRFREDQLDVR